MRCIATADWHIRSTAPRIRKDEYAETQFKKIKWILKLAAKRNADVIVAGDIFDAPRCPYWLLNRYMMLFAGFANKIYVVPGQHDMHYHNPVLDNTPLATLLNANVVRMPDNIGDDIVGVPFGEDIDENIAEVLMIHKTITPEEPPFYMEDAISADEMIELCDNRYELIVSGDYHVAHCTISEHTILINPGPIMRASKDKMNYAPKVYFYDDGEVEEIEIPITEDVFDEDALEQDANKEYSEELKELIQSFKEDTDQIEFWAIVDTVIYKMDASEGAKGIIYDIKENC